MRGGWPNYRASTIFLAEATTWEIVRNGAFISFGIEEFTGVFASGVNAASDSVDQFTAIDTRAVADVTVRDSLFLELRFWIIFVDNHFVDFNGLIFTSVGGIWSFGDQFIRTWSGAIIGTDIDSGAEKADPTFGGFDVAMDGSIEIVWGVNRGLFFYDVIFPLRCSINHVIWVEATISVSNFVDRASSYSCTITITIATTTILFGPNFYSMGGLLSGLAAPHGIFIINIVSFIKRIKFISISIFRWTTSAIGFPGPVCIFIIPSTKIVVADTLRDYGANFGGRAGFSGRITTVLVIGKTWDLIANGEFWCIDTVVVSFAGILG